MNNKNKIAAIIIALIIGVAVGFTYVVFEFIVNAGSNWLWNDVLESNIYRWRVIPIAIVMSILYSMTIRIFKQKRVIPVKFLDVADEINEIKETKIKDILIIFIIGSLSLLAGASLGPESSLLAISVGMSAFALGIMKKLNTEFSKLLALSAITALLSAFFLSLFPLIIPYLLLIKQKKLTIISSLITTISSFGAWVIVHILKGEAFITVHTSETFNYKTLIAAFVLGLISIVLAIGLKHLIALISKIPVGIDKKFPWYITAIIFGSVIGIIYFFGGEAIQFSGNAGVQLLEENKAVYTGLMLLWMVILKMIVTAWSSVSGYRGGQVFPSVFMGVAFSLSIVAALTLSPIIQTGVTIGAVSGILVGMLNPLVGSVLLLSLFPVTVLPVSLCAMLGAVIGSKVFEKIIGKKV